MVEESGVLILYLYRYGIKTTADVVLLTILIVVDNYKSYRDLLFRHPMFRIAFTLNLLYESIMRVALCRVQHLITAAILYFMWLQQNKYWLKMKNDGLWRW